MRIPFSVWIVLCCAVLSGKAELVHRYSFNGNIQDSIGSAHGLLKQGSGENAGSLAFMPDGQLEMVNTAICNDPGISYVDLPNGLISSLGAQATFGIWYTSYSDRSWCRIFDFGVSSDGEDISSTYASQDWVDFIFLTTQNSSGFLLSQAKSKNSSSVKTLLWNQSINVGTEAFVAITWNSDTGLYKMFVNGELVASTPTNMLLSNLTDINNWLGRSQWIDQGFSGLYNEFRIWDHALTNQEISDCYEVGPDILPTNLISVIPQGVVIVAEGESTSISVSLSTMPKTDVQVTFTPESDDLELNGAFGGDETTLIFTPENWSQSQTVQIAASIDDLEENTEQVLIRNSMISSDPDYNGAGIAPIKIQITDFVVNPCPIGDIDGDCWVTASDLSLLAEQWLTDSDCPDCAMLTDDDVINLNDYAIMTISWLKGLGPIVINEFMCDNASDNPDQPRDTWEVFDEAGDAVDWIELKNISSKTVTLYGWSLTDDPGNLRKWSFPNTLSMAPNTYKIIYASGRNTIVGNYIHTNFSLGTNNESLLLVNDHGDIVSGFWGYPAQQPNISYGYADYYTSQRYFSPPTPGTLNTGISMGIAPDTHFSHDRGYYNSAFDLTISTNDPNATIRYTLDGSEPDWDNGSLFIAGHPLRIEKTTILRARSFLSNHLPSNIDTQTYLFLEDIKRQSPNGERPNSRWPASGAINSQRMRYGMTPAIVNHSTYGPLMEDALLALPALSLVTDLPNLFDPSTGIYVNAAASRRDDDFWTIQKEKPCSLELINSDDPDGFQINCGMRIRGGYSRSSNNPKHAFRFFFRSKYGDSKLKYPLFGEEGTDEFDKIDLRTSQNYSWAFENNNQNTFLREVFSRDMQGLMGQPYTRSRYYHLYINGQYWGLYMTQERVDSRFAASYMDGTKEDYDAVKVDINAGYALVATDGIFNDGWNGRAAYRRLYEAIITGVEDPADYYRIQGMNPDGSRNSDYERLLDVDNLIAHIIIQYYTADMDGPSSRFLGYGTNNLFAVYNRSNPDGWKWFEHDSEHSFGLAYDGENTVTPLTTIGSNFDHFNSQWLHEQLCRQSDLYRMHFADTVQKHFFNGGLLTPDRVWQQMMSRAAALDVAIIAESARWGSSSLTRDTWYWAQNWLHDYINGVGRNNIPRELRVLAQLRSVGWFPSLVGPQFEPDGGYLTSGQTVTLSNPNTSGEIYYTVDGSDPWIPPASDTQGIEVTLIEESALKYVKVPTQPILEATGMIVASYYTGISGTSVDNLLNATKYPAQPDLVEYWHSFSMPVIDSRDEYGTWARGLFYPPSSAYYTFWICSDDASQLWLSTDSTETNKQKIAYIDGWTPANTWNQYSSQQSSQIYLTAGQAYYIEAFQKEQGGGDHLQVAWSTSGYSNLKLIPGNYLSSLYPWTEIDYNHSGWISGNGAVVYEQSTGDYTPFIANGINVKNVMYTKNPTCYIRIPFQYDGTNFSKLILSLRYDDGIAVWMNGVEVVRDNAGNGQLFWNSPSADNRSDALAVQPVNYDISSFLPVLRNGANMLAIQGLNTMSTSSDFIVTAELTASLPPVGSISPTAIHYESSITPQRTTVLRARIFNGNEWSPATSAIFADGTVRQNLRISEIMYHPIDSLAEFIEFRNIGSESIDLSQVQITEGIRHQFTDHMLAPDEYIILVKNLDAFNTLYPDLSESIAVEQWSDGALDNSGETITVTDAAGAIVQTFTYNDSWYPITDGDGFSLTRTDPAGNDLTEWDRKSGWRASTLSGGSPGGQDQALTPDSIVINELLAHSHGNEPDWIELHNQTSQAINIGGWFLTDDDSTSDTIRKYEFPSNTYIAAYQYLTLYQNNTFGSTELPTERRFGLSEAGETVFLYSGDAGEVTGYYQASQKFGASATDMVLGRFEKSSLSKGYDFVALASATPGLPNSAPLQSPLVITEIHYNPVNGSDYEFIELLNRSSQTLLLMSDASTAISESQTIIQPLPWRIEGIGYTFPSNITLNPDERIIVARDPDDFHETYDSLLPVGTRVYGPCGKLDNSGEEIAIQFPGDQEWGKDRYYVDLERIDYKPDGTWPVSADGQGDSLQRLNPNLYGSDHENWMGSAPSPGQ